MTAPTVGRPAPCLSPTPLDPFMNTAGTALEKYR